VVDRLPDLRFTFTDGGFDVLMPLMWRFDMDWPISRLETPWVRKLPSSYLPDHFRFVAAKLEGPTDPGVRAQWAGIADVESLLIYGSSYPRWSAAEPADVTAGLTEAAQVEVLGANAARWLRLADEK
jgi:predicted TIM-barrel fold metal-dependent hydrolase